MDRYKARLNLHGTTQRDRNIERLRNDILRNAPCNPSYKNVKINGNDTYIIINTSTSTHTKEFESLPGENIVAGDYVEWSNRTWLVYEADADDEIYVDGKMYECNYVQRWLDEENKLIERPSYVMNASAYNNGEKGNNTITLATNQYMVYMPLDSETLRLRNGKRMFMDHELTSPSAYELTRPDNVSMRFGTKGVTYYIYTQTERLNDDKLITLDSGEQVWIADYHSPTSKQVDLETAVLSTITGDNKIRVGRGQKTYNAAFTDTDGNGVSDVSFSWNITGDIKDKINIFSQQDNRIVIGVVDESCIGSSFLLQLLVDGEVNSEMDVQVLGVF